MNPALSCGAEDFTLRLLLEEAKEANAGAKRVTAEEGFDIGKSEALTQVLHTWANQLQTFGLDAQLDGAVVARRRHRRAPGVGREL